MGPHSSVQTIKHKYEHHGKVQPSYSSERMVSVSCALVRNVWINPRMKAKHLVKMLLKLVRECLYSQWNQARINMDWKSARKKTLLQNQHKKVYSLQFAKAHRDKDPHFWRHVLWSDETKVELFDYNNHRYIWRKKGEACKPENTNREVRGWQHHAVGIFCCRRDWCSSQNRCCH